MAATNVFLIIVALSILLLRGTAAQCLPECSSCAAACCMAIAENVAVGTRVGRDDSTDLMEYIVTVMNPIYGEGESEGMDLFRVNESNGDIFTEREIDRENAPGDDDCISYSFSVIGTVNGMQRQELFRISIEIIDKNDNRPQFSPDAVTIKTIPETTEESPVLTCPVLPTASDVDEGENGIITYTVRETDTFEVVDPVPCVQNLRTITLDHDAPPTNYSFTLVATDQGDPPLSSNISITYVLSDVNDNAPVFDNASYHITVRENVENTSSIFQFNATDIDSGSNSEIHYSINRNQDGILFSIDENTGSLFVEGNLDVRTTYMLEVTARDDGEPVRRTTVDVHISVMDVNQIADFDDLFVVEEIVENMNGTELSGFRLVDSDILEENRNNSIDIITGREFVSVEFVNGFYGLTLAQPVDRETNPYLIVTVQTTENGDPVLHQNRTFNFTVKDVNDNAPSLTESTFHFQEESTDDQSIVNLSQFVHDPDNGTNGTGASFQLVSVTASNGMKDITESFLQNGLSPAGILSAGTTDIDREELGDVLTFIVNITDMGNPPLSNLDSFAVEIIDINDNPPTFESPTYDFTVQENLESGQTVGTVVATDPDSGVNAEVIYSIEPPSTLFLINNGSGEITTGALFDREEEDVYEITVKAQNNETGMSILASEALVRIRIADQNDNGPLFTERTYSFTVSTNANPGDTVGEVQVNDIDISPNNRTSFRLVGDPPSFFSIDSIRGVLKLVQSPGEEEKEYSLTVLVSDTDMPTFNDTATVTISVIRDALSIEIIGGIAAGTSFLVLMICIIILVISCFYHKNKKIKQYQLENINDLDKYRPKSSMKAPTANGTTRSHVTFKDHVEETHYIQQSTINDTDNTIRKESITKFDSSPQVPHMFDGDSEADISADLSRNNLHQDDEVIELNMTSPSGGVGVGMAPKDVASHITNHHHHHYIHPHSPVIVRVVSGGGGSGGGGMANGGPPGHGHTAHNTSDGVLGGFSQCSSDGHTYVDDLDSTCSDDASVINIPISRYGSDRPHSNMAYDETPSAQSHLELHCHLPPMSHGQSTNSSSLAQLQAHNQAQLAEANRQQQQQQQQHQQQQQQQHYSLHSDHTLTPVNLSTQSSAATHSPPSTHHHTHHHPHHHPHHPPHMGTSSSARPDSSSSSAKHLQPGRRNYPPHPLVMPDAFPRDTTDIHRFPIGSYDYGDELTYASTELDEALGFNLEAEPGIISLTATTDYEDTVV